MSLHGTYEADNIFAKILRGEIPSATVYEDGDVKVIMDAFPQSEGHTLIIPKEPARNLLELSEAAAATAIGHVKRVTQAVEAALKPDGIVVTQFNGAPAGQSVFHIHFHVIPRWEGREMSKHGGGQADPDALTALADRIAAKLG